MKTGRTLRDVRKELVKARVADLVAVHLSLRNFWNPFALWRACKFIFKNRKRQRVLARMSRASMGFDWRDARPKKQQRKLGLLPNLT